MADGTIKNGEKIRIEDLKAKLAAQAKQITYGKYQPCSMGYKTQSYNGTIPLISTEKAEGTDTQYYGENGQNVGSVVTYPEFWKPENERKDITVTSVKYDGSEYTDYDGDGIVDKINSTYLEHYKKSFEEKESKPKFEYKPLDFNI